MGRVYLYLAFIIPVMASYGKLRYPHKHHDSNMNMSNSSLSTNCGGGVQYKSQLTPSLPKIEDSHEKIEHNSDTPLDIQYRTTSPPDKPSSDSFMTHLGFSMGLESYPTLPFLPSSKTSYYASFKELMSNFYDYIFNLMIAYEEQITKDGNLNEFHFSEAYF